MKPIKLIKPIKTNDFFAKLIVIQLIEEELKKKIKKRKKNKKN